MFFKLKTSIKAIQQQGQLAKKKEKVITKAKATRLAKKLKLIIIVITIIIIIKAILVYKLVNSQLYYKTK